MSITNGITLKTKKIASILLSFMAGFAFSLSNAVYVNAANQLPIRWISNAAIVQNNTSSIPIGSMVNDYDTSTNLIISTNGSPNIIAWEGNYGATGWPAGVQPYAIQPLETYNCVSWPTLALTGICGWYVNRPNFAYMYFNTGHPAYVSMSKHWMARHEMGHLFGLAHICTVKSVMNTPPPCENTGADTLQPDEINAINSWF